MLKVKVKNIPIFYGGKRFEKAAELNINDDHFNEDLFVFIEESDINLFKGVKESKLKEALEKAKIEIPEEAKRADLIDLLLQNKITL